MTELENAGQWTYVAAAMAGGLRTLAKDHATINPIPIGVLDAAQDFFATLLEVLLPEHYPQNPVESACYYSIAAQALQEGSIPIGDEEELNKRLRQYSSIVEKLEKTGSFKKEDSANLNEMAEFFQRIADAGEKENYDHLMAMGF